MNGMEGSLLVYKTTGLKGFQYFVKLNAAKNEREAIKRF